MRSLPAVTAVILLVGCGSADDGPVTPNDPTIDEARVAAGRSHAYGLWQPSVPAECSKSIHDSYAVRGPDGKLYPTWHPPTDRSGCSFGHEHGRDPSGSALFAGIGPVPFGYANEMLAGSSPDLTRHEDHVGHKIEWENAVMLQRSEGGRRIDLGVRCDFLMKIHQGTHSADAFTNNLHELAYHVRCDDGTELHTTVMAAIGKPGQFVRSCDKRTVVAAGPATPSGSPAGGGVRFIPDRTCIDQFILVPSGQWSQYSLALYEDWITSNYITTPAGQQLAYWDPHFAVFSPSRYYDPAAAGLLGRPIGACYLIETNGDRARGGACDWSTNYGRIAGMTFDDPRSAFDGSEREFYFNQTTVTNPGGPTVWYTDPFGRNARTASFPGAIKQFISSGSNVRPFPLESQAFGARRRYDGPGTHAPN